MNQDEDLPADMRNDDVVMVFHLLAQLLVPPLWVEVSEPLHHRFWKWRYLYLGFFVLTAITFSHSLLNGEYLWLLASPFAHLLAPAMTVWLYVVGGSIQGISFPFVSDFAVSVGYTVLIVGLFGAETIRRIRPETFTKNQYAHDDDEFVVPVESVPDKHDKAAVPPKLNQEISTAFIGETGSGKTSAMQTLAYQFNYEDDTAVVAHDYSTEFQEFYQEHGFEVVRLSASGGDVIWNLFRDVESEQDFREIADAVFGEPTGNNPFHGPAKQVFEGILIYLYRQAAENDRLDTLGHKDLIDFVNLEMETIHSALASEYPDLKSHAVHLDPEQGRGPKNVYQNLHENVAPVFTGDFAKNGAFSINDYVANPGDRGLIIDSDPTRMATIGPMFRVMLDWSIRYAMDADNPTVHVLDEIDQLPPLKQVPNLTARGRAENARALIGVQTVGQLDEIYKSTSAILGNCPQGVYFGPGDQQSTDYVLNEVGEVREHVSERSQSLSRQAGGDSLERATQRERHREVDRNPLTSGDLRQFQPGECVIKSRTRWWQAQIRELETVKDDLPDQIAVGDEDDEDDDSSATDEDGNDDAPGTSSSSEQNIDGESPFKDLTRDRESQSDFSPNSDGFSSDDERARSDDWTAGFDEDPLDDTTDEDRERDYF